MLAPFANSSIARDTAPSPFPDATQTGVTRLLIMFGALASSGFGSAPRAAPTPAPAEVRMKSRLVLMDPPGGTLE